MYSTLLEMSRSNELKEQGFGCRCSVTDSQLADLAASVPSPVELSPDLCLSLAVVRD